MNKFIFFALSFFSITYTYSQYTGAQYRGASLIPTNIEIHDMSGRPLPINDHSNIDGSPLFKEIWTYGIVRLVDEKIYSDSSLNYSCYDDKLFVRRNDFMYPVNSIKEFTLQYPGDSGTTKAYYFRNGFPNINNSTESSFYQVLEDGKKIKLLKRIHTVIREIYNYGGRYQQTYSTTSEYYAFLVYDQTMVYIGSHVNLKLLDKKLPGFALKINSYSSTNKLNFKNDEDVAGLFLYLEEQENEK